MGCVVWPRCACAAADACSTCRPQDIRSDTQTHHYITRTHNSQSTRLFIELLSIELLSTYKWLDKKWEFFCGPNVKQRSVCVSLTQPPCLLSQSGGTGPGKWVVRSEGGDVESFDAVVLTQPAPQVLTDVRRHMYF